MSGAPPAPELPREHLAGLRVLFPVWDEERVVYLDEDLVVVDKPEGISTHAADEGRRDDVVSRLGVFLGERDGLEEGAAAYLGIHQRLDRDTSGVLLFARRKAANPSLAAQFEGRTVRKVYVAVVEGPLVLPRDGVLRHLITDGPGERRIARVLGDRARRRLRQGEAQGDPGKEAVTHVRVLETLGQRRLVELSPRTGRTHQLRAQLAAAGAPIVGDVLYEGAPARRLMLHARELTLQHPASQKPLAVAAPVPPVFAESLRATTRLPGDSATIEALLRAAAARRFAIATRGDTDVFRIFHGGGDGMTGLAVDLFADRLVVHLGEEVDAARREAVLDAALALGAASVYVKVRPKQASRLSEQQRSEMLPRSASRGAEAPPAFVVEEHGVPFEVRLGDGFSTGLFLDQRENRSRVASSARGKRVLNLFAYTGSFTVAAVTGGAERSVTVDVSPGITAWSARNLARVGADPARHQVIDADCFDYLAQAARGSERFDLVVLDPPSFATTKSSRFSADGDYRALAASALRVVAPGGQLLACTNHRGIVMAKLRRFLHEAARDAGVTVARMKDLPPPVDFPPEPGSEPHLKCVLVTLT